MTTERPRDRLHRVSQEFNAMPERKRIERVDRFASSLRVFQGNSRDFHAALRDLNGLHPLLWTRHEREPLDLLLQDAERKLHNFVAAAGTLIEHSRVLVAPYAGTPFFADYTTRVKETFADDPLSDFVKSLRNYVVHVGFPVIQAQLHLSATATGSASIVWNRDTLLASNSHWKSAAKRFLSSSGDTIDLGSVVAEYEAKVLLFHGWVRERLKEYHAPDFENLAAKNLEFVTAFYDTAVEKIRNMLAMLPQLGSRRLASPDMIFRDALLPDDWAKTRTVSDPLGRCDAALSCVEAHVALPDDLKSRIRAVYAKHDWNSDAGPGQSPGGP